MTRDRRYIQKVAYEHYPDYCCECKSFGHNFFKCPKLRKVPSAQNDIEPIGDVRPIVAYVPKKRVDNKGKGPSISAPSSSNSRPNKGSFGSLRIGGSRGLRAVTPMPPGSSPPVFGTVVGAGSSGAVLNSDGAVRDVSVPVNDDGGACLSADGIGHAAADSVGAEKDIGGTWIPVGKKGSRRRGGATSSLVSQ